MFIIGVRKIIKAFNDFIEDPDYTTGELLGDTFGFIIIPVALLILYLKGKIDYIFLI